MNLYASDFCFKGTWRTYQKRILDRAPQYLKDKKLHIVAAPGSGKTTLGIELILRLGEPCLILSPSITIRQQWLERVEEGFLNPGTDPALWLSNSLKEPGKITAVTYQALHSAEKRFAGALEDEEDEEREEVDFSDFDLYRTLKEAGIRTVCLDEAHHLRSEWWKALENLMKNLPDATLISLTATPPYDSTPAQWKRYIDLCGPIDEEIFTPELVKENSLCPHQDYVYFNWPTAQELASVEEYKKGVRECMEELMADEGFARTAASHKGLSAPEENAEFFLDHPAYFSSLLIFLNAKQIPFSPYLKELTGTGKRLPKLDAKWMEILLQGFLYDDFESYASYKVYRERLIEKLKSYGCIQKNKVCLTSNDKISKLLINSKGKLDSIADIAEAESKSLGEELRLLILCDFIKKESLSLIGDEERPVNEIGAVPVFEYLRRKNLAGLRLGILSGSVVVVPEPAVEAFRSRLREREREASFVPINGSGYVRVNVKGSGHDTVAMMTELFAEGWINTLIGTKALLGEGWDSPCINSLILATFVGSFMLSNQMRGRAIRTVKGCPDKTSNIWHLVCVSPGKKGEPCSSEDYEMLKRRFRAFLGVSFEEDTIENGIERLGIGEDFYSQKSIERINRRMIARAADRDALRRRWKQSLDVIRDTVAVEEVSEMDQELLEPGFVFFNAVLLTILSGIISVLAIVFELALAAAGHGRRAAFILIGVLAFAGVFGTAKFDTRVLRLCTPVRRMKAAGEALLEALKRTGQIESTGLSVRAETKEYEGVVVSSYLKGGTVRDKTLFAVCMSQLWGVIDNPRYLLMQTRGPVGANEYLAVPEAFGRKKEDAGLFADCMSGVLGRCRLVYTRTPEGRKVLLAARTHSFVNKNDRYINGKKEVKNEFM